MKTLDNKTIAAIPGRLILDKYKYEKYFKIKVNKLLYEQLNWCTLHLPFIRHKVHHYIQTREHLLYGCLNPAVVVDADKSIIAVFTSLTAVGETQTPVVKILRERLDLIDHSLKVENGTRFAAASIYLRTPESWRKGCWSDFNPIIVDCLVDNKESCQQALIRLNKNIWELLTTALNSFNGKYKEGLYPVDVSHDMIRKSYDTTLLEQYD